MELAEQLNETSNLVGMVAIVLPYPFGCWDNDEQGWTVARVPGRIFE